MFKNRYMGPLGEISADYWATKAIGYYMQDRNFEKTEGVEFLRVNFEILWKSRRGIHADGQFRGDYMMGKNPTIRSSSLANQRGKILRNLN